MNKTKIIKLFSLAIGLSAVIWLTWSLMGNYNASIYFTEPNILIRTLEICMGIFSIPFLVGIIIQELHEKTKIKERK